MTLEIDMQRAEPPLLDLVSFKWLMAGQGWWVNLSRMRQDPTYARNCAQIGLASDQILLQQRSGELLAALQRAQCEKGLASSFALSNSVRI
jgi:hypothetical protein